MNVTAQLEELLHVVERLFKVESEIRGLASFNAFDRESPDLFRTLSDLLKTSQELLGGKARNYLMPACAKREPFGYEFDGFEPCFLAFDFAQEIWHTLEVYQKMFEVDDLKSQIQQLPCVDKLSVMVTVEIAHAMKYWRTSGRLEIERDSEPTGNTAPTSDDTDESGADANANSEPQPEAAEPTPNEPAVEQGEANRYAALKRLKPAHRKAYLSFLYVEAKQEKRLEDRDAWEWLREYGVQDDSETELQDYKLPIFATWARYVRAGRKAVNERKYTPRTGRKRSG